MPKKNMDMEVGQNKGGMNLYAVQNTTDTPAVQKFVHEAEITVRRGFIRKVFAILTGEFTTWSLHNNCLSLSVLYLIVIHSLSL